MNLKIYLYRLAIQSLDDLSRDLSAEKDNIEKAIINQSDLFDETYYKQSYPDIRDIDDMPLHYVIAGASEGRRPSGSFDTEYYSRGNEGRFCWRINPLVHYIVAVQGMKGSAGAAKSNTAGERELHAISSEPENRRIVSDVVTRDGGSAGVIRRILNRIVFRGEAGKIRLYKFAVFVLDYVSKDKLQLDRDIIASSGLFKRNFYKLEGEEKASVTDPLVHFLIEGCSEGRNPNSRFDVEEYFVEKIGRKNLEVNPLVHYILVGKKAGLRALEPREGGPDSDEAVVRKSGLFDEDFYRGQYADVGEIDDVLAHYVYRGSREGRWPNADFDPAFYEDLYADVAESGLRPFIHYLMVGRAEGRITKESDEGAGATGAALSTGYFAGDRTIDFEESRPVTSEARVDALAFYLPQFHPIPENDEWWGKGFTEWTNVSKARSWFTGHIQPRLPADLGFYDLRLPDVMAEQAELARLFGLKGFCFHYYWFGGKRLLERPLDNLLERPDIALPFCLCWANENWTRRWDGQESEVLIAQVHSAADDVAMIADVARYMRDPRYYRIGGKPLFVVYRPDILPEPRETLQRWRAYCRDNGIGEIVIAGALTFGLEDPMQYGFDIGIEFPPHNLPALRQVADQTDAAKFGFQGYIFDYLGYGSDVLEKTYESEAPIVRTVMPGWDNTARRGGRSKVFVNASPANYQRLLTEFVDRAQVIEGGEKPLVMINAWNEWAEGAYLEPDRSYGFAFLNATSRALGGTPYGRLLLPEIEQAPDAPSGVEVRRYEIRAGTSVLSAVLEHGDVILDHDMILLPGDSRSAISAESLAAAMAIMHEDPLVGVVAFDTIEPATDAQTGYNLLSEWRYLTGITVRDTQVVGPAFSDRALVRTNALRPLLDHKNDIGSSWLPDPARARFIECQLGGLCEARGYTIRLPGDEDV